MPQTPLANSTARPGGEPGANSFTESQARGRLTKDGYSQVSGLTKGNDGIWRGTATKNGNPVQVGVDYKGNISMN
jgi:putative membrane protein